MKLCPKCFKQFDDALTTCPTDELTLTPAWIPGEQAQTQLLGLGYDRVQKIQGSTYKDNSTIIIIPTREDKFHWRVFQSWQNLIKPMNQKSAMLYCVGDEVGVAYDRMIDNILADPELSKWKYILTIETDNLPVPDALIRLLETIDAGKYDAVGGIYFTRGDFNMPMAYGDPEEFKRTGVLDFRPRDIRDAIQRGHVMEVNGLAMGFTLYRMDLFRALPKPWFCTVSDVINGAAQGFTQDLFFCRAAKNAGKRFAVDMRAKVGHLDLATNVLY